MRKKPADWLTPSEAYREAGNAGTPDGRPIADRPDLYYLAARDGPKAAVRARRFIEEVQTELYPMKVCLQRLLLLPLPTLLMVGCEEPPPRALHTVNYYRTHEADRKARLDECRKDPAAMSVNPDCLNAAQAETPAN